MKPGGMIGVDDSWRYPMLRTENNATSRVTCAGAGPGRRTVTSTDFFLY